MPRAEAAELPWLKRQTSTSVSVISPVRIGKPATARAEAVAVNLARFAGQMPGSRRGKMQADLPRPEPFELPPRRAMLLGIRQAFCADKQALFVGRRARRYSLVGDLSMSFVTNRRSFLQTSAAAGLGYWVAGGVAGAGSNSPNEKIQLGCVGVGGKGKSDVQNVSEFGQDLALCDVDATTLEGMGRSVQDRTQLRRLPRDARQDGRPDRRGDRQHARPQVMPSWPPRR